MSDKDTIVMKHGDKIITTTLLNLAYTTRQRMHEIPVTKFLDLLNDRIVPWRLEEIGFKQTSDAHILENENGDNIFIYNKADGSSCVEIQSATSEIPLKGCKTYTDLLHLIRMMP